MVLKQFMYCSKQRVINKQCKAEPIVLVLIKKSVSMVIVVLGGHICHIFITVDLNLYFEIKSMISAPHDYRRFPPSSDSQH